ncbi:MAG: hypothetical protein QXP65_01440 [Candidatus Hadarchaeales archaeon]
MSIREINRILKRCKSSIKLLNPNSAHFLVAGVCNKLRIKIEGSVGYYLGTCMRGPEIHVTGNAGWYTGDNMTEGSIVVDGSSGDGTGQGMYGGTIVVKGNCGSRTGQLMKNGTVIIGGNSGYMTGLYAFGGRIIVCGDVGHAAGESIIGGRVYVGGRVASLGKNATVQRATREEYRSIKELLDAFDIKTPRKFLKIVPLKKRIYYLDIGEG